MTPPLVVTLTLPWSLLLPDNHRLMPVVRKINGRATATLITAPEYRTAKSAAAASIAQQWGFHNVPWTGPVQLHALLWFPDARKRDAGNYRKMLGDALTGVAVEDDSQIHRETWERAGLDRTNPRVVIELSELKQ